MRGEVLHYDVELGVGFITGQDGQRYGFERSDFRRVVPVTKGTRVEFRDENGRARDIFVVQNERGGPASVPSVGTVPSAATAPAMPGAPPPPQHFGRYASVAEAESTGMWSYFIRTLSANYANFRGRARRKEYWSFVLFWWLAAGALVAIGLLLDSAVGNLDYYDEAPVITIILGGLFFLATILPGLALCIRRQHDIGLSGWFYLLFFVPYVGSLIIFVFSLIPSQKHDNKWGPVPEGVRY